MVYRIFFVTYSAMRVRSKYDYLKTAERLGSTKLIVKVIRKSSYSDK